ncbi:MAG TPA: FAD-dependent oxidoreductase, partial [Cytophagaceae bacterium]
KHVLPHDLPEIDFQHMDIYLIDAGPRLLAGMSENASKKSYEYLKSFGINIKLNTGVKSYDGFTATLSDGTTLVTQTLIWAAGVTGSTIEGISSGAIKANRYLVDSYNKVQNHNNIYAVGDIALMIKDDLPRGHPMVAQVAIQQGKQLGENLAAMFKKKDLKAFKYKDPGSMATIGRNRAVVDLGRFKFAGFFAWVMWMFVHLLFLIGFRNKAATFVNWIISYFTYDRATRLIIRPWVQSNIASREE